MRLIAEFFGVILFWIAWFTCVNGWYLLKLSWFISKEGMTWNQWRENYGIPEIFEEQNNENGNHTNPG